MNCREVRDHIVDHLPGEVDCPLCREHLSTCSECRAEAELQAMLGDTMAQLAELTRHPAPQDFEASLIRTCSSALPFRVEKREFQIRLPYAVAVAAIFIAALGVLFAMYQPPSDKVDLNTNRLGLTETAGAITAAFGTEVIVAPDALESAMGRTASLHLSKTDASAAAKAAALAFGLEVSVWNGRFVLEDRSTAWVRTARSGDMQPVRVDLSLLLSPEELALFDRVSNRAVTVDDLHFSTSVARNAKLPFVQDDSDVTISRRPDETFEVRRSLPWLLVDQSTGMLEFMAITPEDRARFETIRELVRAISEPNPPSLIGMPEIPAEFSLPVGNLKAATIGEALELISARTGVSIVVGSGADPRVPVDPDKLSGARTVAEALDAMCAGRAFYFTFMDGSFLIDDAARLQRFLCLVAVRAPKDTPAALHDLAIQSSRPEYFAGVKRTGAMTAVFRDFVIVRHHLYPMTQVLDLESGR